MKLGQNNRDSKGDSNSQNECGRIDRNGLDENRQRPEQYERLKSNSDNKSEQEKMVFDLEALKDGFVSAANTESIRPLNNDDRRERLSVCFVVCEKL